MRETRKQQNMIKRFYVLTIFLAIFRVRVTEPIEGVGEFSRGKQGFKLTLLRFRSEAIMNMRETERTKHAFSPFS